MQVAWDIASFLEMYPQFGECGAQATPEVALDAFFETACTIIGNGEGAIIPYDPSMGIYARQIALYALVCHLATLNKWGANGQNVYPEGTGNVAPADALRTDRMAFVEPLCRRPAPLQCAALSPIRVAYGRDSRNQTLPHRKAGQGAAKWGRGWLSCWCG